MKRRIIIKIRRIIILIRYDNFSNYGKIIIFIRKT